MPPTDASTPLRTIPSLDGMRALSIGLVILSHCWSSMPPGVRKIPIVPAILSDGHLGVAVFFVISGYLITQLLLKELDGSGTISLKRFYFRRSLRIFPAFYVFMGVMAILWAAGIIPEHWPSFIAAATYTRAYYKDAQGYFIAHTWSLSIEEQFYLAWPLLVLRLRRKRALYAALASIVLMPLGRFAMYWITPSLRGHEGYMIQGWIDTLMIGCLLALLKGNPRWEHWHRRYLNAWTTAAMAAIAFIVTPYIHSRLDGRIAGAYGLLVFYSVQPLCIGAVLLYVVENSRSLAGRVLNNGLLRHVGMVSYSLYLWQQLFTAPELHLFPWGLLYLCVVAEASYWLIEQPALRLRSTMERRFRGLPSLTTTTAG
ncbi:MAG TPA: acyltransferase [Bryobacteraceae bacterium]|nr:acyltransferase [Bryobacteraceae bacterium]